MLWLKTRYYQAYLSEADVIAGTQIRTYDNKTGSYGSDFVLCNEGDILPQIILDPNKELRTLAVE